MNWAGCQSFNRLLLFLGKWRNNGHRLIALGKLQRLQADAAQGLLKVTLVITQLGTWALVACLLRFLLPYVVRRGRALWVGV